MAQPEDFNKLTVIQKREDVESEAPSGDERRPWQPNGPKAKFGSGFQLSLGDLLDAELGANPNKADLVALVRTANKKLSAKQAARAEKAGAIVPIPEPVVVPAMAKKWSADHVRSWMQGLQAHGVTPLQAILRDVRDPHYKKEGGLANLMTHHQTFTTVSKDGDMYMCLAQLPIDKFDVATINQVRAELAASNEWVMTNGPSAGLYHRIKAGLERVKPAFRAADYLPFVVKHFPVRKPLLRELAGQGARDLRWVRVDLTTSYGAPFMKPKVSAEGNFLPQMMSIAGEIMAAIAGGTLTDWVNKHPALCVALLKNKLDKYLLKETETKIRPYYTYPAHWNILFSAIWQSISDAAVTFLEDPESINAHGFSWGHGGAQKLYEWIADKTEPGIYVVAYSDDQLWLVITKDKKKYLIFPDYKMMDMSLGVPFGQLALQWLKVTYEGKWDKTWQAVAEMNCRMGFEKAVLVSFALAYLIRGGLGSGIPGTAEFDQIASCAAMRYIVPALTGLADLQALTEGLQALSKTLRLRMGLEIKEETLRIHEFLADDDYPWFSFLGHAIRRVPLNGQHVYVPIRPRDKLVLSYVQPKGTSSADGLARLRSLQSRLIGITASGGWYYDEMYFAAKRLYEYYAKEYQVTPAPEHDMTYAEYLLRPGSVPLKPWAAKEFPPKTWFQTLVAPWTVHETAAPQGRLGPLVDMGSVWTASKGWDEQDHDAYDEDKGVAAEIRPKGTTDVAKQGMVEPLTVEQKKAYNARVAALKRTLRGAYATGIYAKPLGKGRARGTKTAAWLATQVDEYEKDAEAAVEDENYDPQVADDYIPDEVLDEMRAERFEEDDLLRMYPRAVRASRDPSDYPSWMEGRADDDYGRGGVT
nr:MAG: RNA-dependent RNA polymerase [Permutotetraviridae sp.]